MPGAIPLIGIKNAAATASWLRHENMATRKTTPKLLPARESEVPITPSYPIVRKNKINHQYEELAKAEG